MLDWPTYNGALNNHIGIYIPFLRAAVGAEFPVSAIALDEHPRLNSWVGLAEAHKGAPHSGGAACAHGGAPGRLHSALVVLSPEDSRRIMELIGVLLVLNL